MPGSSADLEKLRAAFHNRTGAGDSITLGELQKCAKHVLDYIIKVS